MNEQSIGEWIAAASQHWLDKDGPTLLASKIDKAIAEAREEDAKKIIALEYDKQSLIEQWSIMARACGNWREWSATKSQASIDRDEKDWAAAAGAVLQLAEARQKLAAIVAEAYERFGAGHPIAAWLDARVTQMLATIPPPRAKEPE